MVSPSDLSGLFNCPQDKTHQNSTGVISLQPSALDLTTWPQILGATFLASPLLLCSVAGLLTKASISRLWEKYLTEQLLHPSSQTGKEGIKDCFLTSRLKQGSLACPLGVFLLSPTSALWSGERFFPGQGEAGSGTRVSADL